MRILLPLAVIATLAAGPAFADCTAPDGTVQIPDGTTATREEMIAAWAEFAPLAGKNLPMAPAQPVEFVAAEDRPQPRLDRMRGAGMAATVGRLRPCGLLDWKFTVLSHNTIRGAAGAALLNAELLVSLGKLDPVAVPA